MIDRRIAKPGRLAYHQGVEPERDFSSRQFGTAALISAAVLAVAHLGGLTDRFIINDDVRQQIYWMAVWRDPGLFEADPLSAYARVYVPWGVRWLYRLGSLAWDPVYFSKLLPIPTYGLLGGLLFLIGRRIGNDRLGWAMVGCFWLMPFFPDRMAGGLARSFAAPLIALFWYAWLADRDRLLGLTLILQALLIPYILPLGLGALGLARVTRGLFTRFGPADPAKPYPRSRSQWLIAGLACALVAAMALDHINAGFGPLVNRAEMAGRPEFGPQGRYPWLPVAPFWWELSYKAWSKIGPFQEWGLLAGGLVTGLIITAGLVGLRRAGPAFGLSRQTLPRLAPAVYLALSSLILHLAATLLLARLFVPDRYLAYSGQLLYGLLLALGLGGFIRVERWPIKAGVLILAGLAGLGAVRSHGAGLTDYTAWRPLAEAVAELDRGALIAGHPHTMDNVLTFGRRKVLVSYELAHPWSRGWWPTVEARLADLIEAYYSPDPARIEELCRKYGIDYLVAEEKRFKLPPAGKRFSGALLFQPYDDLIRQALARETPPALLTAELGPRTRIGPGLELIDVRGLRKPVLSRRPPPAAEPLD